MKILLAIIALSVAAIAFLLFEPAVAIVPPVASPKEEIPIRRLSVGGDHAKVLYAVVEEDGVYVGDQKVGFNVAHDVVVALLAKEDTSNVMILATDLARYGDLVQFYTSFDQRKITVSGFPTIARTVGFRLPLFGRFHQVGCGWIDETNHEEFL